MGKFGPGTTTNLKIKRSDWKATAGAIENKNRPESVYINIQTWIKPRLSVVKAQTSSTYDPASLAVKIMGDFDKQMNALSKIVSSCFDPAFFDTSSIIFTSEFAIGQASAGKRQFLDIEINIDTVNDIDIHDNPSPHKGTGKVNHIPFNSFVGPLSVAVNKILDLDVFNARKSIVDFAKTKGA